MLKQDKKLTQPQEVAKHQLAQTKAAQAQLDALLANNLFAYDLNKQLATAHKAQADYTKSSHTQSF